MPRVGHAEARGVGRDVVQHRAQRRVAREVFRAEIEAPVVGRQPRHGEARAELRDVAFVAPADRLDGEIRQRQLDAGAEAIAQRPAFRDLRRVVLPRADEAPVFRHRRRVEARRPVGPGARRIAGLIRVAAPAVLLVDMELGLQLEGVVRAQIGLEAAHVDVIRINRRQLRGARTRFRPMPAANGRLGERDLRGLVLRREARGDLDLLGAPARPAAAAAMSPSTRRSSALAGACSASGSIIFHAAPGMSANDRASALSTFASSHLSFGCITRCFGSRTPGFSSATI